MELITLLKIYKPISAIAGAIVAGTKKIIDVRHNKLRNQTKRSSFFIYQGIDDKREPELITFPENKKVTLLTILFSAFNERFSLFKPLPPSDYHLKNPRRQLPRTIGDPQYVLKFNSFHDYHIIPFSVRSGIPYKTKEDFLKLLNGKIRLTYIIGSVGCGKSTFISHLVHLAAEEIKNKKMLAVLSISAKELDRKKGKDHRDIVFQILEDAFSREFKNISIKNEDDFTKAAKKHFRNHKLIIIVDDLDRVYDQSRLLILKTIKNRKALLDHFGKNKGYIHIAVELFDIIKNILDTNDNVSFIVGLRDETYKALNAKYREDTGGKTLDRLIDPAPIFLKHLKINDVLEGRFKMQGSASAGHSGRFYDFALQIAKAFDGLHVNGTRHVMAVIRSLSKVDTEYLFYTEWMIQLYLYLDGIQKYNQQLCGILNIFLVNIDYRNVIDPDDLKYPRFTKIDHYQTYWLKYFICKYFDEIAKDKAPDAEKLHKEFPKYERAILNFCLYSLTDTKHGRLISCSYRRMTSGSDDYMLQRTNRLIHCFNKKIFFSFVYLSVIVNDEFLEIPKDCNLDSIFSKKYVYDHDFFVQDDATWKKWLFEHIEKCLVFMCILEVSLLEYEKENLPECLVDEIPNFQEINSSLEIQIKEIAKTINVNKEDVFSRIDDVKNRNIEYRNLLVKFFEKYSKFRSKRSKVEISD